MLSYLRRRNNSLNGSQCCIDFGSRVQVGAKVVLTLEGAVQAKMGWLRGWTGGHQRPRGRRKLACRHRRGLTVWGGGCKGGTDGRPPSGVG